MLLVVITLAGIVAGSIVFAAGVLVGAWCGRRDAGDAGGIAPHEALRALYGSDSTITSAGEFRPIPEARGDWWGV